MTAKISSKPLFAGLAGAVIAAAMLQSSHVAAIAQTQPSVESQLDSMQRLLAETIVTQDKINRRLTVLETRDPTALPDTVDRAVAPVKRDAADALSKVKDLEDRVHRLESGLR